MKKKYLISLSGGKDSTAVVLFMLERRDKSDLVFNYFDTGWEHPSVYRYLDYLETSLKITINRIGGITFEELCIKERYIPNFTARFCTRILKHEKSDAEIKKYVAAGFNPIVVTGVRRAESPSRKYYQSHRIHNGVKILQPIAYWTVEEVFAIHKKHNIKHNPLYDKGWSRVGCYPCIFAKQSEIGLLEPWAIQRIRKLENKISEIKGVPVSFFKEDIDSKIRRSSGFNALGLNLGCLNPYGQCE